MRKLEEHFCTYSQTLALKKLGFDEPCLGFYAELRNPNEGVLVIEKCQNNNDGLLAPLRSQALDFFRDKGYTFNSGLVTNEGKYAYDVVNHQLDYLTATFDTCPEAESALIDKLIELEMGVQNGK